MSVSAVAYTESSKSPGMGIFEIGDWGQKDTFTIFLRFTNSQRFLRFVFTKIIIFVKTFDLQFSQETAKESFGLRVKLPPVYHIRWRLHTVPFIAERQVGKL